MSSDKETGALPGFLRPAFGLYIMFVGIPGSLILAPYALTPPTYLTLSCLLAGIPMIISVVFEKARYTIAVMVAIVSVYVGIAFVNRVDVPDAEPERASEFARDWLAQYASDSHFALRLYNGRNGRPTLNGITKVDLNKLSVEQITKFSPSTLEERGNCNVYDVQFTHPFGEALVGVHQCYDGGPEFEVWRASGTFDPERTNAADKQ